MLESLGEKLRSAMRKLAGKTVVDKAAVEEFIRELQRALIASDVEVKLVFELSEMIKKKALEEKKAEGFSTRDHVLRVIHNELLGIVGKSSRFDISRRPLRIMMAGLFASGKTTTCGKLGLYLKKRGVKVGMIGADVYRPAAQEQLRQLGQQIGVDIYAEGSKAEEVVTEGLKRFAKHDAVIIDTAGRNALDKVMIDELHRIRKITNPDEVILVVPADLGQSAGVQAREFSAVGLTGVIVTKMEGTAKGGGALVACAAAGIPIKFVGLGEKMGDLDIFEPNGFVSRLLGWGDIGALVRKAEDMAREKSFRPEDILHEFNLDTFYKQLEAARSMGPMKQVLQMLGVGNIPKDLIVESEGKLKKYKFMIDSMTKREKKEPGIIDKPRIDRIAKGSGCKPQEVRELLKHFNQAKKMIKIVKKGRMPRNMAGLGKLLPKGLMKHG